MKGIGPLEEMDSARMAGPLRRMLSSRYAHYRRVAEILAALSRFGLGRFQDSASTLKELHLDSDERKELRELRRPVRVRMLLESLGPTFIKLGQMLSTRPDLAGEELAEELGKLRDEAPAVAFADVRATVEEELGRPLEELFASFKEVPVATASIGQVHEAKAKEDGARLAVKVQRPGVREIIRVDIEILRELADIVERLFRPEGGMDATAVVEEFAHMLAREVDYTVEARNIARLRANLEGVEGMVVPDVHWELSTRRVLTMDFMDGVPVDRIAELGAGAADGATVARIVGTAYIKQIFVDGFFHADPHQGNIFALHGGGVCLLDFGAIGYLDDRARERTTDLYMSLVRKDPVGVARALVELSEVPRGKVDMPRLEWDVRDFVDHMSLVRGGAGIAKGMNQRLVDVAMRNGVAPPTSFVLLERALLQVEGVCRTLDPAFDVIRLAEESLPTLVRERLRPRREPLQAVATARDYAELLRELPGRLDRLLTRLDAGELTIKAEVAVLEDIRRQVRRVGLMLVASLVAIALVFYITWAGTVVDIPDLGVKVSVPLILVLWVIALVAIWRRT